MVVDTEKYLRLSTKRELRYIDIWFIHQCLNFHLTPKFASLKTSKNIPIKIKSEIERKLLRKEICIHYAKINSFDIELKILYDKIVEVTPFLVFQQILQEHHEELALIKQVKFDKINKKLNYLKAERSGNKYPNNNKDNNRNQVSHFSSHKFHTRVKNLTNCNFNNEELDFLSKGLKFSTQSKPDTSNIELLCVEIDSIINSLDISTSVKNNIKTACLFQLNQQYHRYTNNKKLISTYHSQIKIIKSISHKIRTHELTITKADKGNCLIIMYSKDYINKVENFLSDNTFIPLNKSPMNKLNTDLKAILSNHSTFFEHLQTNPKSFIVKNPLIPHLYGLPKIHKLNFPIRPVVSFVNTPLSNLAQFVNKLLNDLINYSPKYTVKNTQELVSKLSSITLPSNFIMVSFDVTNLFTNVPRQETIPIVSDLLLSNKIDPQKIIHIKSLLQFCLSQDFFVFNNKLYRQPEGLAMGNPLSPLLADLFLDSLETKFVQSRPEIILWHRYVDDILAFIEGPTNTPNHILSLINGLHPSIKFTLETEINNSINFLDLTIEKTPSKLEFSIFRKPTQTDHIIPNSSNHPYQQKMSAFHCYIHRLLNIPMSKDNYNNEVSILKQLAVNNGYSPLIIDNIIRKKLLKIRLNQAFHTDEHNTKNCIYRSISYLGPISDKVSSVISNKVENLKISFKTKNTIKSLFSKTKDKIDKLNKSGIYKLSCGDCSTTYVGRTMRTLSQRIKEHVRTPEKSNFGYHVNSTNHSFSPTKDSQILHNIPSKNYRLMNLLEDLEISREMKSNPDFCVNTQINLNCNYKPLFKYLWETVE
ncbi:uncharacterized protein LOC126888016 [Diabrotica virgifera virgifera]|uniref:Reverse transcriptase domain-containing protein n=1 Tax=Diabrotica virgifera virgifera TaxID=50390 RepID=A0ABM5KP48_DIAVI|nr:uncharacterized protein LOC126888016 [Diabrotica virgifera virgifera]